MYYELTLYRSKYNKEWPGKNDFAEYGIFVDSNVHDSIWGVTPPGASMITWEKPVADNLNSKMMTIRFYSETDNAAKQIQALYFNHSWYREIDELTGDINYIRGRWRDSLDSGNYITTGSIDRNKDNPNYWEITIVREDGNSKWPTDRLQSIGILAADDWLYQPAKAEYIVWYDETSTLDNGDVENSFNIRFAWANGTETEKNVLDYFLGRNDRKTWYHEFEKDADGNVIGVTFTRGKNNITITPDTAVNKDGDPIPPWYYTITLTENEHKDRTGWPKDHFRRFGIDINNVYDTIWNNGPGVNDFVTWDIAIPEDDPLGPESLIIRFHTNTTDHEARYFGPTWFREYETHPDTHAYIDLVKGNYSRGKYSADFTKDSDTNNPYYYEIVLTEITGVNTGWPINAAGINWLMDYGIDINTGYDAAWKNSPAINTFADSFITWTETVPENGAKSLSIWIYSENEGIKNTYFGKSWYREKVYGADNVTITAINEGSYTRSTFAGEFTRDIAPVNGNYYEITLTALEEKDNTGWPTAEMANFGSGVNKTWGVNDYKWEQPPKADFITWNLQPNATGPDSLSIKFYWKNESTGAASEVKKYFFEDATTLSEWLPEGNATTVGTINIYSFDFSRGTTEASFQYNDGDAYYELTLTKTDGYEGWPKGSTAPAAHPWSYFGNGVNKTPWNSNEYTWTKPSSADFIVWNNVEAVDNTATTEDESKGPDTLSFRFYWAGATAETIRNTFFGTWCFEGSEKSDPLLPAVDTFRYSRGSTEASFQVLDSSYYDIELTRIVELAYNELTHATTVVEFMEGWPKNPIANYGNGVNNQNEWLDPIADDFVIYDNVAAGTTMSIKFYWDSAAAGGKNAIDYFFSKWHSEESDTAGIYNFSRGTTEVSIQKLGDSHTGGSYYEIELTKSSEYDGDNWPSENLKNNGYGNGIKTTDQKWITPSGIDFTTWTTDTTDGSSITIKFYWTASSDSAAVVENNFFAGWFPEGTDTETGSKNYTRGSTWASFRSEGNSYYEITVSRIDDCDGFDWPASNIALRGNGVQNSPWTNPDYDDYVTWTEINEVDEKSLTIRFYWTNTSASAAAVEGIFFGTSWCPEVSDSLDAKNYSRGTTWASFRSEGSSYYEISLSKSDEFDEGWPKGSVLAKYGLSNWVNPPAGADFIAYIDERTQIDETEY